MSGAASTETSEIALACVAAIAASDDVEGIARELVDGVRAIADAEVEVVITRGDRELARAGIASATSVRVAHRLASSRVGVELTIAASEAPPLAALLVRVAASAAHRHALTSDAQQLARERQEIVAIVSHDLRTPLQSLGLGLDAIELLISGTSVATPCASTLARMERSVASMGRLLGDLLDVTRIHDGALSMHVRPCDADKLVREMVEQHAPLAAARGLVLYANAPASGMVKCDASRITQALSNFVSNAIRHATLGPIELRLSFTDDCVRFEVADRGPGISPEVCARLFDRLYQASSDGGRRGGLGLGLYIAKGIAAAHGGRIGVDSEVGRGSTFWIELDQNR